MLFIAALGLHFLTHSEILHAEPEKKAPPLPEAVWQDFLGSSQFGFDSTGWTILGLGGLATVISHQYDGQAREHFKDHQKLSPDVSHFGAVWGSGIPGSAIALTQLYLDPQAGLAHAEAIAFTSVNHISIAVIAQRGRPSKPNSWTSFPSGHSASAWATASSLSYAYGWTVAIPAVSAALLTQGARLSDDKHWLSDTVAGATLGLFWGRATAKWQKNQNVRWTPFVHAEGAGLGVRYDF